MKQITLVIHGGNDQAAAKAVAESERKACNGALIQDAWVFDGVEELCSRVVIMPDVSMYHRARIEATYGNKVASETVGTPPQHAEASEPPYPQSIESEPRARRGRPPKSSVGEMPPDDPLYQRNTTYTT